MSLFSRAVPALVESLFDEPFYQAITADFSGDTPAQKAALARYFAYSLGEAKRTGRCVIDPRPELGAAVWLLPCALEIEACESVAKADYLAGALGRRGNEHYHRIVRSMAERTAASVPRDAWYLSIVGVAPAAQGQGVGATLIRPTLQEAARAGAVCYLETFTPRNHSFYRRLGFKTVATHQEPVTNAEYAVMRWDP